MKDEVYVLLGKMASELQRRHPSGAFIVMVEGEKTSPSIGVLLSESRIIASGFPPDVLDDMAEKYAGDQEAIEYLVDKLEPELHERTAGLLAVDEAARALKEVQASRVKDN